MPSLAGLFGRKRKSPSPKGVNGNASELNDSSQSSPTTEFVTSDRSLPSSPNTRSTLHPDSARGGQPSSVYPSQATSSHTSSHKLRLPFSRKKVSASASTTSVATTSYGSNFGTPPRPAYMDSRSSTSASSDTDIDMRRLRPPPSKSAIFAAYGDPHSALSTHSLPTEASKRNEPAPIAPPVPPKKPSFFHWSRSTPSSPQTTLQKPKPNRNPIKLDPITPSSDVNSFNLKSFRHVLPPSPNTSSTSLTPAIPRPRGTSIASESSQRISVAAFREAHARRSAAGSPVPSNRAPSPHRPANYGSSDVRGGTLRPTPQFSHSAPNVPQKTQKRRSSGLAYTTDSDEDESSEEVDSDASASPSRAGGGIIRRKRTVTKRPDTEGHGSHEPFKSRATKSEIGHGSSSYSSPAARRDFKPGPRSQSSHILKSQFPGRQNSQNVNGDGAPAAESSRSHSSIGFNASDTRPRASVSASALSPSAAAKRASIIAAANANLSNGRSHVRASSTYSKPASPPPANTDSTRGPTSASSSDSEDDAPLATLLPPRRPGSAMSSASSPSRSNVSLHPPTIRSNTAPHKPLIDINELTHGRPSLPSKSHTNEGFTPGSTLLSGRGLTTSPTSMTHPPTSPMHNTPIPTSTSPPTHFVSPPSSPTKEFKEFISAPAPHLPPLRSSMGFPGASASGAPTRETSPGEHKRDVLGDRLSRVLQMNTLQTNMSPRSSAGSSASGSESASGSRKNSAPGIEGGAGSSVTPTPAPAPVIPKSTVLPAPTKLSPADEDLATMLGAGVSLISRTGDPESSESESESDDSEHDTDKEGALPPPAEADRIAPIPIKQRAPPPAFSVTSRPPVKDVNTKDPSVSVRTSIVSATSGLGQAPRQRSSTLVPPPTTSSAIGTSASSKVGTSNAQTGRTGILNNNKSNGANGSSNGGARGELPPRQRSTTLLPSTSTGTITPTSVVPLPPSRPFVGGRRESPASSTGDSSSGRAPFTPKDGSEIGSTAGGSTGGAGARSVREEAWSGGVSGLPVKEKHIKRRSVSFEEDLRDITKPSSRDITKPSPAGGRPMETHGEGEERRRERRRSEAKAAIELGNVINGRGPIVDDDDDDLPINQMLGGGGPRMSTLNPMMTMSSPMPMGFPPPTPGMTPGWNNMNMNMGMNMNPQMLSPAQFMPPAADPNYIAAHQQAMMYAKQAYQMAVAQQAMAAAGDEWERGSSIGGFGGGGSVYGGGLSSASVVGSPYGMGMGMGGMGMNMGMQSPGNGWSTGSVVYPGPARSMYGGISGARSEYGGGGGGGGNWSSSKSSYGESFGPSSNRYSKASSSQGRPVYGQRDSGFHPPLPPIPQGNSGSSTPSGRGTGPRSRTASQPASPGRGLRKAPPPSSWKAGV
ncbi:hypothetical protein Hypma_013440 [Hypsizygus marmoreus]|uniref:Uncharacterized protein n=1 Tax=Hypsizygus marmoreus TaxID=39966 RepID=A0A369JB24_HYPMA|nr:hypothetical protein Hypma_013440 [Hypsizygus marmoreus]